MYSGLTSKTIDRKEKMEFTSAKETVVVPSIKVTEPEVELRRRVVVQSEEKPFSWYSTATIPRNEPTLMEAKSYFTTVRAPVESKPILEEFKSALEEIKAKQEEVMPKGLQEDLSEEADETAELRQQIQEVVDRERAAVEEKEKLELELSDLAARFDDDEKALASFEQEKRRFQDLIDAQQRKGFDFQQEIIALKNQLVDTQSQLAALKQAKQSAKVAAQEKPAETQSAWGVGHAKGFTEMVAEAQRDELQHPKKFSEVLKDALKAEEPVKSATADEFTVIGGELSAHHITAPSSTASA